MHMTVWFLIEVGRGDVAARLIAEETDRQLYNAYWKFCRYNNEYGISIAAVTEEGLQVLLTLVPFSNRTGRHVRVAPGRRTPATDRAVSLSRPVANHTVRIAKKPVPP